MAASLAAKTRRSSGLLRCGFAGWGLLLVDAIVRNSGGRDHPLPRRVHDDVPGGEVRARKKVAQVFAHPLFGPPVALLRSLLVLEDAHRADFALPRVQDEVG